MKMMKLFVTLATTAMLIAHTASAAVAVSNLGQLSSSSYAIGPFGGSSEGWANAQAFSTPTTGLGWDLNSLTMTLREFGSASGPLTVGLYSDASGSPGTLLVSLTGASPSGDQFSNYTYTPTSSFTLAPNSTYFAVLTAPTPTAGNFYQWGDTTTAESGDPGWSIANVHRSNFSGSTWTDGEVVFLAVDVTPVPEPSTFALAGLGLAGLLIFRRRKA